MTVDQAILTAERLLPGEAVPEGTDPRWQAVITVGQFIEDEPEAVWSFIQRWGSHTDLDLRDAIATCLLEHLLEHHFEAYFPRVEIEAHSNPLFGDCFSRCWPLGQSNSPTNRPRFDRLKNAVAAV